MRIKATCGNCDREFVPELVAESGGHCPWCGNAFSRDYTALVAQALRRAEVAGDALENALEDVGATRANMDVDEKSILEPLRERLRGIRKQRRARV